MKISKNVIEEEYGNEEGLYEDVDYNFHRGCCETAEVWMRAIDVSPRCNFIVKRLNKPKHKTYEDLTEIEKRYCENFYKDTI